MLKHFNVYIVQQNYARILVILWSLSLTLAVNVYLYLDKNEK